MSSNLTQEQLEIASVDPALRFPGALVIVGGGMVDAEILRELYLNGAHLVGADGGADQIVAAGLKPEAIIGDLDSLANPISWVGKTHLLRLEEQLTTDFEKALYSTSAPVTIALGITGRRFDHTLAALDAVHLYAPARTIIVVDEADLALAVVGPFAFAVAAGERVSIHPLAPIKFKHSEGLKYPLDGLRLAPKERNGTSNEALTGAFSVEPLARSRGAWLLIVDKRHLGALVAQLLAAPPRP